MKLLFTILILLKFSLSVCCSKPPCSLFEFLYKYEEFDNSGAKTEKRICIIKCPFGCAYGTCQPDRTCECQMGATYLKHDKTGEIEFEMCNFQCNQQRCECFDSWCYLGSQCVCNFGFSYYEDVDCCMNDPGDPCKG